MGLALFNMKSFLFLAFLFSATVCSAADSVVGTLTFDKSEAVFFRFSGGQTKYADTIPGMKVLGRSQLSKLEGDRINGVPMLIIELTNGDRLTLIQGKPVPITRTTSGTTVTWLTGKY